MQYSDAEIFCMQLLTYLVSQQGYQIVTLRQKDHHDYWLTNPSHPKYPVICLNPNPMTNLDQEMPYLKGVLQAILMATKKEGGLLIINTHEASQPCEAGNLRQICMRQGVLSDPSFARDFADIDKVIQKVKNNQDEYFRLTRVLERKAYDARKMQRPKLKEMPRATMIILGICFAVFVICNLLAWVTKNPEVAMILCGAYYKTSVVGAFEYFRLLTAGFVHYDIFHLLMNSMALFNMGMYCEKRFGMKKYLIILLVSIICGNCFVFIGDGNVLGLGISGGLFGLLGAYIVSIWQDGLLRNQMVRANLISVLMMNLFISLLPSISLMAHLGGFVAGCILAVVMSEKHKYKNLSFHTRNAGLLLAVGLVVMMTQTQRIDPAYYTTDGMVIANVKNFGLDGYGDYLNKRFSSLMEKQGNEYYRLNLQLSIAQASAELNKEK